MPQQFLPQEVIRKKRDGHSLTDAEIAFMVQGITDQSLSEVQLGAFAMAVFLRGMTLDERISITRHMMNSGEVMQWQDLILNGPVVDKHSTGGVGDKVSLMLAPIVAACGAYVPMVSGRGLGHTGGTLDKLESIPGYDAYPSKERIRSLVKKNGCVIVGQTDQIAPADRRFYAARDVTATVESIDLITASILSKKLAEGLDALVMDVKTGTGAFAAKYEMAESLAKSIATVASGAGVPTRCLLTDMNQVLGKNVGNALEIRETIQFLTKPENAEARLLELTLGTAVEMLLLSRIYSDRQEAEQKANQVLNNGKAAEIFGKMVADQGGPLDLMENMENHLPACEIIKPILANESGFVSSMDVRAIGISMVAINAGRTKPKDGIDHQVGLSETVQLGEPIEKGAPLAMAHVHHEEQFEIVKNAVLGAINIDSNPQKENPLIYQIIDND